MQSDILVSVCCITYNHEAYIRDALEGFVRQKTTFKFEVIVHDDASLDGTQAIIREYAERYPDLIFPILQTENQWAKYVNFYETLIMPRMRGKYIAACEGDDFWTDPNKLQMQVDYMESHPQCTFCCTNGIILDMNRNGAQRAFVPFTEEDRKHYIPGDREVTLGEMYQFSFVPTASCLCRKDSFAKFPDTYTQLCPNEDLIMRLFHTALGTMAFLDVPTCVYRQNVPDSVMTSWNRGTKAKYYQRSAMTAEMIDHVDAFSDRKYSAGLFQIKKDFLKSMLSNEATLWNLLRDLKRQDMRAAFGEFPLKRKIAVAAKTLVSDRLLNIKRRVRQGK